MRTNILRPVAIALGLSIVAVNASAGDYQSPSKWSGFNAPQTNTSQAFRTASNALVSDVAEHAADTIQSRGDTNAPVPAIEGSDTGEPCNNSIIQHGGADSAPSIVQPGPVHHAPAGANCNACGPKDHAYPAPQVYNNTPGTAPVHVPKTYYRQVPCRPSAPSFLGNIGTSLQCGAMQQNVASAINGARAGRRPCGISPWFGGANLLFLDVEDNSDHAFVIDDTNAMPVVSLGDLDPDDTAAFDLHFGRYLDNGIYGLDFGYFLFDPDVVEIVNTATLAGDYRATNTGWNQIDYSGTTVYDHFDAARAVRVRRDMRFQGFEANLVSFGKMGSRRVGAGCNQGLGRGHGIGSAIGLNTACGRYGGVGGPLSSPYSRVQVTTSHGLRWFQIDDSFDATADLATTAAGYAADDLSVNMDVENNLIGYQFGSTLNYCLNCHWLFNIGAKFGIYANDVEFTQRIGSESTYATTLFSGADVSTTESDTVLAALGELNIGLTYRFSNAWSVQGGYRMLAATGIATATGSIPNDYARLERSSAVYADDSLILHGGYFGVNYNW